MLAVENKGSGLIKFSKYTEFSNLQIVYGKNVSHSLSRHTHSSICITAIINGARKCISRKTDIVSESGKIILMGPGVVHTCQSQTKNYSYVTICIDPRSVYGLLQSCGISGFLNVDIPLTCVEDNELYKSIFALVMGLEEANGKLTAEGAYFNFVVSLLPYLSNSENQLDKIEINDKKVNIVREYILEKYDNNISLEEISQIANISPFYLNRIFSEVVGVPPHLFQNIVRINRAKKLLDYCYNMTDVATMVGFSDQSHFIRMFKKIVGMTPSEYKNGSRLF